MNPAGLHLSSCADLHTQQCILKLYMDLLDDQPKETKTGQYNQHTPQRKHTTLTGLENFQSQLKMHFSLNLSHVDRLVKVVAYEIKYALT